MTVMRGNTVVRDCIADFLGTAVPVLIEEAREQWGLDQYMLPEPQRYDSYDPLTASNYPEVGSLVSTTDDWRMQNLNNRAEEEYSATYAVRVYMWCETPRDENQKWIDPIYDECLRLRDDLTALIRSAILHSPSLGRPGVCRVLTETLTEDYLDAIKGVSEASWLAGSILSFNLKMNEHNYEPTISEGVEVITVEASVLPQPEGVNT